MDGLTLFPPQCFAEEEAYPTFSANALAGSPLWGPLRAFACSSSSPLRRRLLAWPAFVLPAGVPDVAAADAAAAVAAAAAKQRGNLVAIVLTPVIFGRPGWSTAGGRKQLYLRLAQPMPPNSTEHSCEYQAACNFSTKHTQICGPGSLQRYARGTVGTP